MEDARGRRRSLQTINLNMATTAAQTVTLTTGGGLAEANSCNGAMNITVSTLVGVTSVGGERCVR